MIPNGTAAVGRNDPNHAQTPLRLGLIDKNRHPYFFDTTG